MCSAKGPRVLLALLVCVLVELRFDTLKMGLWNRLDVSELNDNSKTSVTRYNANGGRSSQAVKPNRMKEATPTSEAASGESAAYKNTVVSSALSEVPTAAEIVCDKDRTNHRLSDFLKRLRAPDGAYAGAGTKTKPGYFTPCYHVQHSNRRFGLRGWRCSHSDMPNGTKEECLIKWPDWISKNYGPVHGDILKSASPHHPQDIPCEAAQKVDPSCKCPAWREPEGSRKTLRKWETWLAYSKTDVKFYKNYYRPDKAPIWDVDSAEPDPADSLERNACDAAIRESLPANIKALLASGQWAQVLKAAEENGFVETFLHTRSPDEMVRPKERFDWVLGGGGQVQCPMRGLVKAPNTVLSPMPYDATGGNMHILDYALATHSDAYTSMLNYDVEAGQDGGGLAEWKPGDPFRVLVVAGSDYQTSLRLRWTNTLLYQRYFHRILWEAHNRDFPGIHVAPIGFNLKYTRMHGADTILEALLHATPLDKKNTSFLAAWGQVYSYLDGHIPSRKELIKWLNKTNIGNRQQVKPHQWWTTLGKYRFQLCPTGAGVQSPKIQESWMSNVIPIVQAEPAFVELKKWGYPIVVVKKWDEITESKMEQWWQELSPHLAVVKWMLLADVWFAFVSQPCPITNIVDFLRRAGINENVLPKAK